MEGMKSFKSVQLEGALEFQVRPLTRAIRLEQRAMKEEIGPIDNPALAEEYQNIGYLAARTELVTAHSDAIGIQAFMDWYASRSKLKLIDWFEASSNQVLDEIFTAWWLAVDDDNRYMVSAAEAAPELLTKEELEDPKSKRRGKKTG